MSVRLFDMAGGSVGQFKLKGFKPSEPPRLICCEFDSSYSYFLLSAQKAGGMVLEYRETPPLHVMAWELKT